MAWYDNGDDFWNLVGDPAGYVSGYNTEGLSGIKKGLFGDPESIKKAYDDMMGTARQMTGETRQFLGNQQGKALAQYAPMQHMFQSAYGTNGLTPPLGAPVRR